MVRMQTPTRLVKFRQTMERKGSSRKWSLDSVTLALSLSLASFSQQLSQREEKAEYSHVRHGTLPGWP